MRSASISNIYPRVISYVNPKDIYQSVNSGHTNKMTTKEKFKEIRRRNLRLLIDKKFCGKQVDCAQALGRQPDYISRIINGQKGLGEQLAREFENKLGLEQYWFDREHPEEGGQEGGIKPSSPGSIPIIEWENPEDLPEGMYALVPRVMVKLSAGNGYINYEEETGPPLAFQSSWIKREGLHRSSLCVVEAHGDSMEDRIHDGDVLVVDTSKKQVVDGKVYALRYQNELRVKRLYRRYDGGLILHSDNKDKYPPENIPPEGFDHIEIIGRVVHLAGRI
jgi:hypothetical protein